MVPTFTTQSIGQGGAQLYSGNIATPMPQAFSVASPPHDLARDETRPVLPGILGHTVVGEELREEFLMSYGPRSLAEDVDEHRPVGRVQDLFLLQSAPTSGVEYERNLMHTHISFKRS